MSSLFKNRFFRVLVSSIIVVLLLLLFHVPILKSIGNFLDVSENIQETTYVFPLAGGVNTRPFIAAEIYNQKLADRVLLSQVSADYDTSRTQGPTNFDLFSVVLIYQGVPQADIQALEGDVFSTFDEAKALKRLMEKETSATVSVVTTHYHTRRARMALETILTSDQMERIHMVSAPSDHFTLDNWWQTESGFTSVCKEYLKTFFYYVRYRPFQTLLVLSVIAFLLILFLGRKKIFRKENQTIQEMK